jgi:hypothetical protein
MCVAHSYVGVVGLGGKECRPRLCRVGVIKECLCRGGWIGG